MQKIIPFYIFVHKN